MRKGITILLVLQIIVVTYRGGIMVLAFSTKLCPNFTRLKTHCINFMGLLNLPCYIFFFPSPTFIRTVNTGIILLLKFSFLFFSFVFLTLFFGSDPLFSDIFTSFEVKNVYALFREIKKEKRKIIN